VLTGSAGGVRGSGRMAASKVSFGPSPVEKGVSQTRISRALTVTFNIGSA